MMVKPARFTLLLVGSIQHEWMLCSGIQDQYGTRIKYTIVIIPNTHLMDPFTDILYGVEFLSGS